MYAMFAVLGLCCMRHFKAEARSVTYQLRAAHFCYVTGHSATARQLWAAMSILYMLR